MTQLPEPKPGLRFWARGPFDVEYYVMVDGIIDGEIYVRRWVTPVGVTPTKENQFAAMRIERGQWPTRDALDVVLDEK